MRGDGATLLSGSAAVSGIINDAIASMAAAFWWTIRKDAFLLRWAGGGTGVVEVGAVDEDVYEERREGGMKG